MNNLRSVQFIVGLILMVTTAIEVSNNTKHIQKQRKLRPNESTANHSINFYINNLKCNFNESWSYNNTCFFKPTRDRSGKATIYGYLKRPIYDVYLDLKVFYKYRVYQPWMISFDGDVCGPWEGTSTPPKMLKLILENTHVHSTAHSCPFIGMVGFTQLNFNALFSRIYPQVIPNGEYRNFLRWHSSTNITYFELMFQGIVEASHVLESFQMG